jgi:protein O-GlcNAc transferase
MTIDAPRSRPRRPFRRWLVLGVTILSYSGMFVRAQQQSPPPQQSQQSLSGDVLRDGPAYWQRGRDHFRDGRYDDAATDLWKAVLLHTQTPPAQTYDVQDVFRLFLQCYVVRDRAADGLAFVAGESFRRGQDDMGRLYLQQALGMDPRNDAALLVQAEFGDAVDQSLSASTTAPTSHDNPFPGQTPEQLYEVASRQFSDKNYEACADVFELSCQQSGRKIGPSCANAVYCRNMLTDWGFNGTQFDRDMQTIATLVRTETAQYRFRHETDANQFVWQRATSPHPHMMLGYPVDPLLKRYVAESAAYLDEQMARLAHTAPTETALPSLPPGLPYHVHDDRQRFADEQAADPHAKIRVGFVGSGFNSKAVLYLSQDMFRFFGREFEIHVFSFGPRDHPMFIERGMRGVDWRERVKSNVHFFHDCQAMKLDHIKAARFIHDQNIHILIEWDGYARQGERAQGLFALRPAPIQILHQEYLGTSGALYVDYLFTDQVSSPPSLQHLYTEKLIYLPNHFFSKGHAYQKEVREPRYEYQPVTRPHQLGTGSPQENRCLAPPDVGPTDVAFVYCNFNKFLKNNPETVRGWIQILRQVPDSILCLLDNPRDGIPYLHKFIHEAAGTSDGNSPDSFQPGDGDDLVNRVHFLPWEPNPFDHQQRNRDFCNAMLDSHPYNGHTVAQDALYAGVPIVTRSDGDDMSARVTTSANLVLGLSHLNAVHGPAQYVAIAVALGTNATLFRETRERLIGTALQRNPMHPYWDVARYVLNFESGLRVVWERFLRDQAPDHVVVEETADAARGTYDDKIRAHPPQGNRARRERAANDEL